MEIFHAIVLGIVQGLTEFLPISSSGHLVLVPWLFRWEDLGLTFDVALHIGTLFALVVYFWNDWLEIFKRWREPFLWLIVVGCIPAAAFGYKFDKYFETVFRSPVLVASFLIGMGLVLLVAEILGKKTRAIQSMNLKDSIGIGLAQVLALMPGVSRSGITMTAGLFFGLNRETAARFSFLLATPIVFGAGLIKLKGIAKYGIPGTETLPFVFGTVFAAVSGYFAIKYLMKFLQKHTFYIFVWYRFVLGAIVFLVYFLRK